MKFWYEQNLGGLTPTIKKLSLAKILHMTILGAKNFSNVK